MVGLARCTLLIVAMVSAAVTSPAWADLPTEQTVKGDSITHPVTGDTLTVVEILDLGTLPVPVVVAEDKEGTEYVVLGAPTEIPVTFKDPNPDSEQTYTITDVVINDTTGLVEQFILDDGDSPPLDVALVPDDVTWAGIGGGGDAGGEIGVAIPEGNLNIVANKRNGAGGGNGNDGGGIRICFFGCFTIGYDPTKGKDGQQGPTIDEGSVSGTITSISDGLPGITVSSIGGNGGDGGDGYGVAIQGARGGSGGYGGDVSLVTEADITTSGKAAHGIFAQSRSGSAGDGGSGFIFSSGGEGGPPGHGGTVTVTNNGPVVTLGDGAIGVLAQSLGGSAGNGGDSWGLVGVGGSSLSGGHGGTVTVNHNGVIQTEGFAAQGIVAQSIGGTGGNGGSAGGVVSFGGGGSAGGDGGDVNVLLGAEAGIHTHGDQAHGILAQSIGGGGGNGGTGGGVAAFGGTGEAGGDGATVRVRNADGSVISTTGDDADGIVAQSIGGGGGDGGVGSGAVALGGAGAAAGTGGFVEMISGADISTQGRGARGLFAQSVGGGGGSARGASGVVALGGRGGSGGDGGAVLVNNSGDIATSGHASDGIIAQSVGGGGGSGGSGSGLAGLGGAGESGGNGGVVSLSNEGRIQTLGDLARGLFAQSVGGGGGFGGNGNGLAGIGGAGGTASDGGDVAIHNQGAVSTQGGRAHGVQAQSIGGGGGDGGTSSGVLFTLGGSGGGGGDAGTVMIEQGNDVTTAGDGARGVFAQSVGGGGGNGGASYSGSAFAGVAIGGNGGAGGDGSDAAVTLLSLFRDVDGVATESSPVIWTEGDQAEGILSQSLGGGGGNGGQAVQVSAGAFGAVSVAVGGSGGDGGRGGKASLSGDATVRTAGKNADAVVVQSVGGGGGSGGGALSVAASAGPASGSFSFALGGSGGGGGDGGAVQVDAGGEIQTLGDLAEGLLAQSVGGGGGKGGWAVSVAGTVSEGGSVSVGVGLGGSGGSGGDGGRVGVAYDGDIRTAGENASAWTAQSIGGGGGQGGFSIVGAIAASGGASVGGALGIGGSGGDGGDGGAVEGRLNGDVTTQGNLSRGVLAQSVGGGGGSGGINVSGAVSVGESSGAVAVGLGGSGGGGGDGDTVDLHYQGMAATLGNDADAVIAQSVGGGGGQGGMNISGSLSAGSDGSVSVAFGLGGSGGGGGDAGAVSNEVGGVVSTQGDRSAGVVTQSVGGGGGAGGVNVSGSVALSGKSAGNLSFGIGGAGGDGGDAGNVVSSIIADVFTQGEDATAVLTQSVGGGGGNGALNVAGGLTLSGADSVGAGVAIGMGGLGGQGGQAGSVELDLEGDVGTSGKRSSGVVVQSAGGGGGNGAMNIAGNVGLSSGSGGSVAAGLGGFGGKGGAAEDVRLGRQGNTVTTGAGSDAVIVQSVGGGGGNGGLNVSGVLNISSNSSVGATLGVGGFGGVAGDAGNVVAEIIGDVLAIGSEEARFEYDDEGALIGRHLDNGSHGIMAQSVGGGGGNGGLNVSAGIQYGGGASGGLNLGVGGFGGNAGDAGKVDLEVVGNVVASGDHHNAVTAQSIGGGGGNGAMNISAGITGDGQVTAGVGGSGGGGGSASDVTASVKGNLYADGVGANGLLVQSVGGGGGNAGFNISGGISVATGAGTPSLVFGMGGAGGAGNNAGVVSADQQGDIAVAGRDSTALLVQSIGGGGGVGAMNVTGALGRSDGFAAGVGIGGSGGAGADADDVSLHSDGNILADGRLLDENGDPVVVEEDSERHGDRATGILVQSIGGGGGKGGANYEGVAATSGSVFAVGVGGSGGGGGEAGDVTVIRGANQAGVLETYGDQSSGLIAQSIGGGGGNAEINAMLSANSSVNARSLEANVVIGGAGGAAADGQSTRVEHIGDIVTHGRQSIGLLAQSVGGGGGNATISLGVGVNPKASGTNLSLGGQPGSGGNGGFVEVDHGGTIATVGEDSSALIVQSIGGGGGNAAITKAFSKGASNKLDLGLGRKGGSGGEGGDLVVDVSGQLRTEGDRSVGLFAQSVGGGGGRSTANSMGFKVSGSQTGADTPVTQASIGVSLGLEGGQGGEGGEVTVAADSLIVTEGQDAHAVHVQSIGGGGGVGGAATDLVLSETAAARMALGGIGGEGGAGGRVTVDNHDLLVTSGEGAYGLYAQSIGGGGGTGGLAGVLTLQTGSSANLGDNTATLAVGGTGGVGGEGGETLVRNWGGIVTQGVSANAITAQSIGGGGGDGGLVLNGSLSTAGNRTSLSLGMGGDGGTGGEGGLVAVGNEGFIVTDADAAIGVFAQSIGGGGGNGGLVADLGFSNLNQQASSVQLAVNLGGSGGKGGGGGKVQVTNAAEATIDTVGERAYGIFAQSIGGGGGNGSSVVSADFDSSGEAARASISLGLNLGGDGGTGGTGGEVEVINRGVIQTQGDLAHGVYAQSIGGGGGDGGISLAADVLLNSGAGLPTTFTVGGNGGDGGDGGTVTVSNQGSIVALGDGAYGILAQSIGGGGGNGNVGLGVSNSLPGMLIANGISGLLGGSGGEGGTGGQVNVEHIGDISVAGDDARAYKMESINGGGGGLIMDFNGITSVPGGEGLPSIPGLPDPGGLSIAVDPLLTLRSGGVDQVQMSAGSMSSETSGDFLTLGMRSLALDMQSVGGGGGSLLLNLDLAEYQGGGQLAIDTRMGGENGDGGHGSSIHNQHSGDFVTAGADSAVAALRSVGGGGGLGFINVSGDRQGLGPVQLALGAQGGSSNNAGDIVHHQVGDTLSLGDHSVGLMAQSIGAGGGELHLTGVEAFSVALGGANGAEGDGGNIEVSLKGEVRTLGQGAHAVLLQSIGGGGGAVLQSASESPTVQLSGDNQGDGGAIQGRFEGNILAFGDQSYGLFAQSLGGGGGYVDGVGALTAQGQGRGAAVNIDLQGSVFSATSTAVFLQSEGGEGGDDLSLSLARGQAIFGGTGIAALHFAGGASNRFDNQGTVASSDGVHGLAVSATDGDDHIENLGALIGSVRLGGGDNALANHAGAWLASGSAIDLGQSGALLSNSGRLDPGGAGLAMRTDLHGSYQQDADGLATMELDLAGESPDALFATGHIALAGDLNINLLSIGHIKPGSHAYTLFNGEQGFADTGLRWHTAPSQVIRYNLVQRTGQDLTLVYDADFAAHGAVTGNPARVGDYLNRVQGAGSSAALADLIDVMINTPELADYRMALNQLAATPYAEQQAESVRAAQQFGRSLLSCSSPDKTYRYQRQGSCIWFQVGQLDTDISAHDDSPASSHNGSRTAVGGQWSNGSLTLGLAAAVDDLKMQGFGNQWQGKSDTTQLGAVAKYQWDELLLTSSLVLGRTDTQLDRSLQLLGREVFSGSRTMDFAAATLGLSRRFEMPWLSAWPAVELGVLRMRVKGESESPDSSLALALSGGNESYGWVRPSLELGRDFPFASGFSIRPYLRTSLIHYLGDDDASVTAALSGAPSSVAGMEASSDLGQDQTVLEAGVQVMSAGGFSVRLQVERTEADDFQAEQLSMKVMVPF